MNRICESEGSRVRVKPQWWECARSSKSVRAETVVSGTGGEEDLRVSVLKANRELSEASNGGGRRGGGIKC